MPDKIRLNRNPGKQWLSSRWAQRVCAFAVCALALAAQTWKEDLNAGVRASTEKNYVLATRLVEKAAADARRDGEPPLRMGQIYYTLGLVDREGGKLAEAEAAFRHALPFLAEQNGGDNIETAGVHYSLAGTLVDRAQYAAAIEIYQDAQPEFERWFGKESLKNARAWSYMGECYRRLGKFPEAETHLRRGAILLEQTMGVDSPDLALTMHHIGLLYAAEHKFREAESAYRLALSIREFTSGLRSDAVRATLKDYAGMLQEANRPGEAARLLARANSIPSPSSATENPRP